ncbi:unnamed protein product [Symbiodinium necroappetens]|uniref:Uncharacterized protein n=1 Tax=Symbiodinium necroappetens TaxID=1628268 RepID=A0A813A5C6_9DINO|nr:unnamed protein product [Symbiodinium necroappetens]
MAATSPLLDAEPAWLQGLQQELHTIVQTQKQMAQQMQDSGRDLSRIQEGIRSLSVGQETLTKRADEQEAALAQMRKEFKELERDLQELKSAPPTRNASPVTTPRGAPARSNSPRFDSDGQREVDELQLVVGGWVEAKREHVESDVRAMFEQLNALPLLKAVFVPYVRSSFCRVELFYTDDNIWAQRKLQTMVLQHLKAMTFVSRVPGQERSTFWFSRNRTPRERAKIRAILQVQSLCQKYLGDHAVDRDWRGKVWANGTQVLFHVEKDRRPEQTLMLVDARGNETGWFLNVKMLEARLGEVGDVRDVELGKHAEKLFQIAGKDFVGYVANPMLCHRMHAAKGVVSFFFVQDALMLHRRAGEVLIGHDLNQDAHAHVDSFDGMLHYRLTGAELSFWKRPDLRVALPPRQTLCGKWNLDLDEFFAQLQDQDPPEVKELIDRRKRMCDVDSKAALMQEIHLLRRQARRSAAGSFTDGSYIQRAGGLAQAAKDLHHFYLQKYSSTEAALSGQEMQQLFDVHAQQPVLPVTKQEVSEALARCKNGVSAGLDGVTFEGLRVLVTRDERNRIPEYFTRLLALVAQVLDGITAAQSVMTLVRKTTGSPCKAIQLAKLCFGTSVVVEEMEALFPVWSEFIQGDNADSSAPADRLFGKGEAKVVADRVTLQDLRQLASSMMELRSSFTFGAYVRVKTGVHSETKDFPQLVSVFTRYIRQQFPDAPFLTFRLQMNEGTSPHKDAQNTYLPSLICNLSPGAPGGTWVEDSRGTHLKSCSDGEVRRGCVIQGESYRISARKYWHAAVLDDDARIVLIGWVPAGWKHLAPADVNWLKGVGFVLPTETAEDRAELSDWRGVGLVQSGICETLLKRSVWKAGMLRQSPPVCICLSSDEATRAFLETPGSRAQMVDVLSGWWSSLPEEWLALVLMGGLLWLVLLVQAHHARTLLTRTMTAVLGVDSRLQQLEAEVLVWRTSAMVAQGTSATPPDADGGDTTMHAEFDLHAQFVLACQDVRGMTMTTQHACDWMGSATKLISAQHDELGDLTRAHIELSKAVNKMLDDAATTRTAGSSPADSIPASWVQELKDALAPSVKAMKDLKSLVESGLNGVNQQLADQDLTPFKDTLKDFFIRFEDGCEKLTKGLELLKQGAPNTAGGANQQVLDALGAMKTVLQNLGAPSKEVLDAVATVKGAVDRCTQQGEKVEQVARAKTTSIYEEVGLLKGQNSQLHKDGYALMKSLEKKMEHQSAILDGFAGSLAQLTAAFGRPPVDSSGVTRLLDTSLSQGEMLKELEGHVGQMREMHMMNFCS